jgi:hypothetical protein
MAVRTDIGKIAAAIEAGKRAAERVNYGPIESSIVTDNKVYFGDFQFEDVNQNIFLFGFHQWGDNVNKVFK